MVSHCFISLPLGFQIMSSPKFTQVHENVDKTNAFPLAMALGAESLFLLYTFVYASSSSLCLRVCLRSPHFQPRFFAANL